MEIEIPPDTEALIFDCDGTLADTVSPHLEAWREALELSGIGDVSPAFLIQFNGIPTVDIVKRINESFGYSLSPHSFAEEKEARVLNRLSQSAPIEPVVSVVRKYTGRLPLAIVSGGRRKNVLATLSAIGLSDNFAEIITADDDVAPKPSPEIFLEAARRMRVGPGKCLVFEDAKPGIDGARKAGMRVVDVRVYTCGL